MQESTLAPRQLLLRHLALGLLAAIVLIPLVAAALAGFKSTLELQSNPVGLPSQWDPSTYISVATSARFWIYLGNSLLVSLGTVVASLTLSCLAAFAVVFLAPRIGVAFLRILALGLMFPAATAVLPIFIQVRDLGLLDTYAGLIVPQIAFGLALGIILLTQFFRELPQELHAAAIVDGCKPVQYFLQIVLPLSTPILATVSTIQFVQSWNSYILPLVLVSSEDKYTWPLGIMAFQGEYIQEWNVVLAFISLTLVPTIVFFLACQRYIVAGLSAGAVKG
jgi:raffinose/stachyose/melibiose transport system permease protein